MFGCLFYAPQKMFLTGITAVENSVGGGGKSEQRWRRIKNRENNGEK